MSKKTDTNGQEDTGESTDVELLRIQIEQQKVRYGFYKFVLGTVLVSVVTTVGNWTIQWRTLQSEINNKQSEFIGKFLDHALDENLDKRRDFAQYFSVVSPSEESRERWLAYLDYTKSVATKAGEKAARLAILELEARAESTRRAALSNTAIEAARQVEELKQQLSQAAESELEGLRAELQERAAALENIDSERDALNSKITDLQNTAANQRLELRQLQSETGQIVTTGATRPFDRAIGIVPGEIDELIPVVTRLAGNWVPDMNNLSVEPPQFRGFFIAIEGSEYFARGTIVRGTEWDGSEYPMFKAVYGYVRDEAGSDWYDFLIDFSYLGPTWRPFYQELSTALFANGDESIGPFTELNEK